MTKKIAVLGLAMLLAFTSQAAFAGKKKKAKKPKPYVSEEVSIAVAHPIFYTSTGEANSITATEFEQTCAVPASQGVDGWVFEVPAAYQKIQAVVKAIGVPGGPASYDLDMLFYDANCVVTLVSQAVGTDETGYMPAGTAWILLYNYLGDPMTKAHIEISAL